MSFLNLVLGITTSADVTSEPLIWPVTVMVPMEARLVGLANKLMVMSMGVPTL